MSKTGEYKDKLLALIEDAKKDSVYIDTYQVTVRDNVIQQGIAITDDLDNPKIFDRIPTWKINH